MASRGTDQKGKRRPPRWAALLVGGALGLVVLAIGLYGFYTVSYRDQVFPRVTAAGIPLGGKTVTSAALAIAERTDAFSESTIRFQVDGEAVTFSVADVAPSYDPDATAAAALAVGRSGNAWADVVRRVRGLIVPVDVPLAVTFDEAQLTAFVDGLSTKYDTPEQNAHVAITEDDVLIIEPEQNGQRFDRGALTSTLTTALETATAPEGLVFPLHTSVATVTRAHVERLLPTIERVVSEPLKLTYDGGTVTAARDIIADWVTVTTGATSRPKSSVDGFYERIGAPELAYDQAAILAYLTTISEKVNQDPIDAKLTIKDGKATVFQASQDGRTLNEAEGVTRIVSVLESRATATATPSTVVELPITASKAQVTSATIEQLGIQELIGTATTDFSGSPSNRVHNITTGTKYLNGLLVKPGAEFSAVKALGSVDAAAGYLPELVIKENRTIPEYGGGLCQVSTTVFRSALNAGLKITERRNHSYRVSYYEKDGDGNNIGPGLDATVYLPKPDFKFQNDTPGWILVQGSVTGNKVTFELYGTKDGRVATIDGPHTLSTTPAPPDVYETSNELAAGEVKQIEKPHVGARTTATYKVTRNGQTLYEQTFTSSYKALPARFLKGPDAAPPAEASEPVAEPAPEATPTETTESPSA
ncbi:VanW family protein [Candidatus Berkelbacteria bacterium]|nr:VanW family protein [Candidatus Berkelbacteria bacterium]